VGESGSGKTLTALAILGLLPPAAKVLSGQILVNGQDIGSLSKRKRAALRGRVMTLVPQNSLQSLDPLFRVGHQVAEPLVVHKGLSWAAAMEAAIKLLGDVRIPAARLRARSYPFQMSGGMRQRAASAAAVGPDPSILIADEPTTALDVTTQRQYLEMLIDLQKRTNVSVLYITHDIVLVSAFCDRLAVFYAGRVVESGPRAQVLSDPAHPYTKALLEAVPTLGPKRGRLEAIPGEPANAANPPPGCAFHPRCKYAWEVCQTDPAPPDFAAGADHRARCWILEGGPTARPHDEGARRDITAA
jgi:oligopeptide/dipeptide ABC transporter ATP-binding protein